MSIQVNANAGAVNWESLLGKIGEVTKTAATEGAAGTTNVTITTRADGVATPVTIKIPDDLDLPETVDQTAIDSLCEKLAANTGLNLTDKQIADFHETLSAALKETFASVPTDSGAKSIRNAMFDIYKLMALLVEVAQKQRDASREMRQAENLAVQKSILNQAEAQRDAALTGMIAGAICCAIQVVATGVALAQQTKAFKAQLGTDKTSGLDVARQNVDMMKAANTQDNAHAQLEKVSAEVGGKISLDGHSTIRSKVETSFQSQQLNEASAKFTSAKNVLTEKVTLSQTMKVLGSGQNVGTVTGAELAPFDAPELADVKTAVAKLDTYKAEMAKLDQIQGLSAEDKAFFVDQMTSDAPNESLEATDRMMTLRQNHPELNNVNLAEGDTLPKLQANVKTAFDAANTKIDEQIAPGGRLTAEVDLAKQNFRAQTKLEMQKFEDAYDAALQDFNEVSKSGTSAEIAAAETKLQTAADELKYARALGNDKLMTPDATDAKTHLADVEDARARYISAQQTRASNVDYIKASNSINNAQATNNLISAIGSFAQSFVQNLTQFQQAEATKAGAEQKKSEEELDQTRDLFNQAEELVNSVVKLMQAVGTAETQSMRDAIQA